MQASSYEPLIRRLLQEAGPIGTGWRVECGAEADAPWIDVAPTSDIATAQGWKLHISADVRSADAVLERVLPVLAQDPAPFKLAATPLHLYKLNSGEGGPAQIGKFITVYPTSDQQAVRLAVALDQATHVLSGPAIPSDRPLRPGSRVHYRYGAFLSRYLQTAAGEVLPAIVGPDGDLVPDQRTASYNAPSWLPDPFERAGVVVKRPLPNPLIGGRYLTLAVLHQSPRRYVRKALDLQRGDHVVLKQARHDGLVEFDGTTPADRLRIEAALHAALAQHPRIPRLRDVFTSNDDTFAVLDYIDGVSLDSFIAERTAQGTPLSRERMLTWIRELALALRQMHEHGILYCDLKTANVIVDAEQRLWLIDLESACAVDGSIPFNNEYSRGYFAADRLERHPTVSDEIYALGAVAYALCTGAEPGLAPQPLDLLARPLGLLNPALDPGLVALVERCLDRAHPAALTSLPALIAELDAQLAAPGNKDTSTLPARVACTMPAPEEFRALAMRLAHALVDEMATSTLAGTSNAPAPLLRDVNQGLAGAVLTLAAFVEHGADDLRAPLAEMAARLLTSRPIADPPLPGLYVGEAGIGLALLRAGQALGDATLQDAAAEQGHRVATLPFASPDLFNGTAGRVRFHLALWQATGEDAHLNAAVHAGDVLLEAAERAGDECWWRIPNGYSGLSGQVYLGYAHGAAGIADALLDLYAATGASRFRDAARAAGLWLARRSLLLPDGRGRTWADTPDSDQGGAFWCHGATGVGRFFLHAAQLDLLDEAWGLAHASAHAAAHAVRWAGPSQCHGLSGNAGFLLDLFRATGDQTYLRWARELGRIITAFAIERDGRLVCQEQTPGTFSPSLMTGYAGVAAALLGLADPDAGGDLLAVTSERAVGALR